MIIGLRDPRPMGAFSCNGCPRRYKVKAYWADGIDPKDIPDVDSCPCGFDPIMYRGCYFDKKHIAQNETTATKEGEA